jgi:hypothetical protein
MEDSSHLFQEQSKKPKKKLFCPSPETSKLTSCRDSPLDLHHPFEYAEIDTSNITSPRAAEEFEEVAKSIQTKVSLAANARKRDPLHKLKIVANSNGADLKPMKTVQKTFSECVSPTNDIAKNDQRKEDSIYPS